LILFARPQNGMTGGFAKGMQLRVATGWGAHRSTYSAGAQLSERPGRGHTERYEGLLAAALACNAAGGSAGEHKKHTQ